ncbi:tumor protein p63-regulated gene 1-like protein isoform X1 [Centruroides sculpturatus]|uniref:tumor protein p63-regulated gene 1-like protein isoform X1 n=1 Tax=Centruroides sculpturatus TaxID=218467 RepID=UPI000C6D2DEF|nr:tumor protein p63-regulated gene 1-like protein isoform X1 [Centruroides sculpturatus]
MADFRDVKLNSNENKTNCANVERLDDYSEAEFRGATLSLSQDAETPMLSPNENSQGTISPSASDSMLRSKNDDNANLSNKMKAERTGSTSHRPVRPMSEEEVREFFAVREGALENAADQCRPVVLENLDGELRGVWLLTEIDHWDTEKERIIFLTDYSVINLKYDFITQRLLDYRRLHLTMFDRIIVGELKYPESSLMPKLNGAVGFIKEWVVPKLRQTNPNSRSAQVQNQSDTNTENSTRNQIGVKCMWNVEQPLPFLKNWNPWCREIPWITYTSHPLAKHQSRQKTSYDIEDFSRHLVQAVEQMDPAALPPNVPPSSRRCEIQYQPVVVENYAGIASAFHNANDLGFFKARGKVSF